jgi:CheY-like chemotaxis protein
MPNVLMIDAEKDFATPLVSAMQGWGYGVSWTPDGKEGLDKATAERPNAIILCVELGKMSGYSICNKLKKDDQLKDIPLIITSREATNETFEQHRKLKTRAEAYLIKPFSPGDLQQVLANFVPAGAISGELKPHDLGGGDDEEDIVLDDLPAGAKEEAFDPGALVGAESREQDPMDALEGFEIAGEDDPDRGETRVMKVSPDQMRAITEASERQKAATAAAAAARAEPAKAAPTAAAKPAPSSATASMAPVSASQPRAATGSVVTGSVRVLTDDERRQMEQKLQEAKTKQAQAQQEVDKLRAEMNQVRTKSREETTHLRSQVQELNEKLRQEQQALKQRYEESTQKAVQEAAQLRQQVKDVQGRAQSEIESLRSQLIEIRNQSQDLLATKDSEVTGLKKKSAELETQVEQLRAENARGEKIRERTVKAVDVALQLLGEDDAGNAATA